MNNKISPSNSIVSNSFNIEDQYEHYECFQDCMIELKSKFERNAIDMLRSYYEEGDPNDESDVLGMRIMEKYYPQQLSNSIFFSQDEDSIDISESVKEENTIGDDPEKGEGEKIAKLYALFSNNSEDPMGEWSKKIMEKYYPQYCEKTKRAPSLFDELKGNDELNGDMDQSFDCLLDEQDKKIFEDEGISDVSLETVSNKQELISSVNMEIVRWKPEATTIITSNKHELTSIVVSPVVLSITLLILLLSFVGMPLSVTIISSFTLRLI